MLKKLLAASASAAGIDLPPSSISVGASVSSTPPPGAAIREALAVAVREALLCSRQVGMGMFRGDGPSGGALIPQPLHCPRSSYLP